MSSPLISQNINTKSTNCIIPNSQVQEIYKGLKQGEYLKIRIDKTEKTLNDAIDIMGEQKNIITNLTKVNSLKDKIISDTELKCGQEKELRDARITQLEETMKLIEKQSKKEARRKRTNGFLLGTGVGVALTTAAVLFLVK